MSKAITHIELQYYFEIVQHNFKTEKINWRGYFSYLYWLIQVNYSLILETWHIYSTNKTKVYSYSLWTSQFEMFDIYVSLVNSSVEKETGMSDAAHRSVCFRRCALRCSAGSCSTASSSEELFLRIFCMLVRLDSLNTADFLLSSSVERISQNSLHACPCLHALLCSDVPNLPASSKGWQNGSSGAWKESCLSIQRPSQLIWEEVIMVTCLIWCDVFVGF